MKIYIATAYIYASSARDEYAPRVRSLGFTPCSSWHATDTGPEDLEMLSPREIQEIIDQNDIDIGNADVMLVVSDGRCRETYAEAARAIILGIPVVWIADQWRPFPLSAYREGVTRVADLDEAVIVLEQLTRPAEAAQ